jgi:UDP-glucose 4-epimerase
MGDERDPPAPLSHYGVHKEAAEGYVRISGLSYGICRPSNVYGPRQKADLEGGVVAVFMDGLLNGRPLTLHGGGDQVRDFIHVDDVVSGALAIAATPDSGTWNLSTGVATSVRALLAELEALLGPAVAIDRGPARDGDVRSSCLSPARIRDLGWSPRYPLRAGLARTIEAMRVIARGG